MKSSFLLTAVVLSCFACANGQSNKEKPLRPEQMMEKLDTNKDGKLSREEFEKGMGERFVEIDKNKDGFLDKEELKAMPPHPAPSPEEAMKHLDANNDGIISKNEAKGPLADEFDKADANADGNISLEELKAHFKKMDKKKRPEKK